MAAYKIIFNTGDYSPSGSDNEIIFDANGNVNCYTPGTGMFPLSKLGYSKTEIDVMFSNFTSGYMMISRSIQAAGTGATIMYTYRGDTTSKLKAFYTFNRVNGYTEIPSIYTPSTDTTVYLAIISAFPEGDNDLSIVVTKGADASTAIDWVWSESWALPEVPDGAEPPPEMIQRSIHYMDDAVTVSFAYAGDTTSAVYGFWVDPIYSNYNAFTSVYLPAPSNQTMYAASIPLGQLSAGPMGCSFGFWTTSDHQSGTRIWYETLYPETASSVDLSGLATKADLDTKSDKYLLGPTQLSELQVGQDVGGMFINFDIPDFDFNEDADGGYAQYDAITFSDGSRIRFENSSWYYMAAQVGISLPNIIHTIVEGGNYWTDSSFTLPDGLTITAIDPRWADSPMSKGHLQDSPTDTGSAIVDCEYNYNLIQSLVQRVTTLETSLTAANSAIAQNSTDLANHVQHDAVLYTNILEEARNQAQEIYNGTVPQLESTGQTIIGTGGFLELGAGGSYVCQVNGAIVIAFSAVLAVGNANVMVNGTSVFDSAALSLLSIPPPKTVYVNAGDQISSTGSLGLLASLQVTFYANKTVS